MSTFLQTLGSTISSPLDASYGEKCWLDLVASCRASKNWADESDDDTDAYLTIPDATSDADTAATVSELAAQAETDDMFSQPYVSFDWSEEDDVSRSLSRSSSDDTDAPAACKSEQWKYLPTIYEVDEEDEMDEEVVDEVCPVDEVYVSRSPTTREEEMLLETPQHQILRLLYGKVELHRLDIVVRLPKSVKNISLSDPIPTIQSQSVDLINQQSPSSAEIDALFDIVPSHILRRIGLPTDAISKRTPIVVRLPSPTDELPKYNPLSNLEMLASLASTRSPPPSYSNSPFNNLNLLADCC